MLHIFRESIGRFVAIGILSLIAVTFVFFGIDFSITQLSFAARVNGETISVNDFDRRLRQEQNRIQQLLLDELTTDMQVEIRRSVVEELVMREVLRQRIVDAGFRISDAQVAEALRNDPTFQAGGRFSQDIYMSLLAQEGLTPAGYEAQQRDLLSLIEWQNGLVNSSFVTPAEFRRNIELLFERREIAYAHFVAVEFLDQVEIDDAEVAEYHALNADLFMTEEAVDIELVELDLASIAETIEITEEELRAYYDAEIERYAVSEERFVRHILIEPEGDDYVAAEAEAEAVLARLEAGEDFAALAAEVSDDVGTRNLGGELGWMALGVLEGPFEDALFAMAPGTTEGPVETEFGLHILRLEQVRASDPQPFEAIRDQIQDELASEAAYTVFYEQANDLANDAYDARDDLASVAEAFGLELETIERLTRSGNTDRFVDPTPVIALAFDETAIATQENSDLIELSDERVAIIRVSAHYLPEPRPFEDVAEEIRSILAREAAERLAAEAATAYLDALNADESGDLLAVAEALAAEHGATWNAPRWIDRNTTDAPAAVAAMIYAQPKTALEQPEILRTAAGNGDEAVALFIRAEPGYPEDIPVADRELGQQDLAQSTAAMEINAYAAAARGEANVRVPDEVLEPQF
ncbi:MAG TPA: SurA N-terminal domain-containing protein [Gammaproteobacteria bacterium]|jgi:peptidyl-prolyl cis-trans isomerase D